MSRIGKLPIKLPSTVQAVFSDKTLKVDGPKGSLSLPIGYGVNVNIDNGVLIVTIIDEENKQARSNYGTTRAKINNMVSGVTQGWKKSLEMSGVGFNAKVNGGTLVLSCGFSHEVPLSIPLGVKCSVNKNTIDIEGYDKEVVGTFASVVRKVQPPEPYLGKGIKYSFETVRRKAGKTGKK